MNIKFTKTGGWNSFDRLQKNLTKELHLARLTWLKRWALKAEAVAKGYIANQDFANGNGWAPLASYTIRKKAGWGASLDTLIETGNYMESITSWASVDTAYVGIRVGARAKRGNIPLWEIARNNEYGVSAINLPARPLWQPTFSTTMDWHIQHNKVGDIFLDNLRKRYTA